MKRTAANSALLTIIKREYNSKIYKHAMGLYNTEGHDATMTYLQQFSNVPIAERMKIAERQQLERDAEERARSFRHLIR